MRAGFAALYFIAAVRTTCEALVFAYLPIALYRQTGDQGLLMISLIFAIPAVVRFFAAHGWGLAIDRAARQKPFVLAGVAAYPVLLAALAAGPPVPAVVALVALAAAFYSAVSPAARTMATLADEAYGGKGASHRILSRLLKFESTGWVIGGMVPGALLDYTGLAMADLLAGASVLAALAWAAGWLWLRDVPAVREAAGRPGAGARPAPLRRRPEAFANAWESLLALYRRPEFSGLLVTLFFTFFAREAFFTTYGIYLTELGGSTTLYGASISIATVLGILLYDTAALAARRFGSVRLVRVTSAVYVAGYLITVVWPRPWALVAYFSLPLFAFLTMAATLAVSQMSAACERGRGLGILEATDLLAVALGSVSAGAVATRFGLRSVPLLALAAGGAGALAGIVLQSRTSSIRTNPAAPGGPEAPADRPEAGPIP